MVDALRAALRLLPVTKSNACVACSRASNLGVGRQAFADQSILFSLSSQHQAAARERQQNPVARFAKAVLTYVGVGLSVVAANQLTGPSMLHAKEVGSKRSENCIMAAERSGASRRCVASNRHFMNEHLNKETSSQYTHFGVRPAEKNISRSKEAKMEAERGLSLLPNDDWGTADKTDLPWQFGPSAHLDYGSQYITLEETPMSELQDFSTVGKKKIDFGESTGIELEWQWIVDQQQPPKCVTVPLTKLPSNNEDIADDATEDTIHDALEEFPNNAEDNVVSETHTKAKKEISRVTSTSLEDGLKIEQTCVPRAGDPSGRSGNLSIELGASKLQLKDSASWRTADSKELAALVSQKTLEHLENCDLPPSQSCFTRKGPLASCDFTPPKTNKLDLSRSVDKILLASLLHGSEPTRLVNKSLPSSPLVMSDPTPLNQHLPRVSQPLAIPTILPRPFAPRRSKCLSSDDRNASWSGSGGSINGAGRGSDTLGEALCHSQTRAREAEKVATQALQEKEQLVRLLFREASTSRTYKQWVQALEIENLWLKMHARDRPGLWMEHSFLNPSVSFERLSNNRWKHLGRRLTRKQMHQHFSSLWQGKYHDRGWVSEGNVVVGCTIGLAFALGLSLAGAGLVIGWSLGWILLAC